MNNKRIFSLLMLIPLTLLLLSCSAETVEEPTATAVAVAINVTAEPSATPLTEPIMGLATVESVEMMIMESFPVQISVRVRGVLSNSCTEIDSIVTQQVGNTYEVVITTVQGPGQICTEAEVTFEETVPLDVEGLDAGTYNVDVNGVQGSFTFDIDNVPQVEATPEPTSTPVEITTFNVNGRIWHDLCAASTAADAEPSAGCISTNSGSVQADGIFDNEPGIAGVEITIGEGACPAAGLSVVNSDSQGNFSFADLSPGTYCISAPDSTINQEILLPGAWTAPATGLAETTITLAAGSAPQTAEFGWDFQFLPAPEVDLATCTNSFEFVTDLNIPDDTEFAAGDEFIKSWQLRNNGTCPWSTDYSVVFVGGDQMSAAETTLLTQPVAVGQNVEVALAMVAPDELGTYRGNFQLADAQGEPFGIDGVIEDAFWLRITVVDEPTVVETAVPNSATIGGVVWDDFCINSNPGRGCVTEGNVADGTYDSLEAGISGITISLAENACPADGTLPATSALIATAVTDADGVYRFESLDTGTYCIFMAALNPENVDLLIPGNWTFPATGVGLYTFILDPGEQALDRDFGWDFVD